MFIKKKPEINDDENIVAEPEILNVLPWIFFILKVLLLIWAFMEIGIYLKSKI